MGGPVLFLDEEVRRLKLIGIIFTKKTCSGYYHTKATEIIPLLDWIVEKTRKDTENYLKTAVNFSFFSAGVFYCKSL